MDGETEGTKTVTVADLQAQLETLRLEAAELRGKLSAAPAPKVEDVREFSRAELDEQVTLGKITQAQADQIIDNQVDRRIDKRVGEKVDAKSINDRLDAEIDEYAGLKPDIRKNGSPDRDRVAEEFKYLVQNGSPETKATELAALRAVFGPLSRLKAAAAAGEGRRETHKEGSGGAGSEEPGTRTDGAPKGLTARQRDHYQKSIDKGLYRDWAAVAEEVNFDPTQRKKKA